MEVFSKGETLRKIEGLYNYKYFKYIYTNMVSSRRSNNTFAGEIFISFNIRLYKNVAVIAKLIFVCFIFFKLLSVWRQSDYRNSRIVLNKSTLMVGKKV